MSAHEITEPFDRGRLQVSDLHSIAYYQHGNPQGLPAVYLHGGPGGGSSPRASRFFHPEHWHLVRFDQRGCGESTPHAEIRENTTWDLVADMERLREHLGFEKWFVCGGSWGSTLGLAYAERHPERVTGLIVRGIFTVRRAELLWFYQEGANWLFPDLWDEFTAPIPPAERGDLMSAYYRRLTAEDEQTRLTYARHWSRWEGATLSLRQDESRVDTFSTPDFALAFARLESHYFANAGFMEYDGQLLKEAHRLKGIPGTIIQGRYDIVTPARTAWELHKAWEDSKLVIVPDAGHSADEPGTEAAMVEAIGALKSP